jgi:cysteine desulfurase
MNVPYTAAQGSIRFSLGRYNTEEDIDTTLRVLPEVIQKLAAMSPYEEISRAKAQRRKENF